MSAENFKEYAFDLGMKRTLRELDDLMNLDPWNKGVRSARAELLKVKFGEGPGQYNPAQLQRDMETLDNAAARNYGLPRVIDFYAGHAKECAIRLPWLGNQDPCTCDARHADPFQYRPYPSNAPEGGKKTPAAEKDSEKCKWCLEVVEPGTRHEPASFCEGCDIKRLTPKLPQVSAYAKFLDQTIDPYPLAPTRSTLARDLEKGLVPDYPFLAGRDLGDEQPQTIHTKPLKIQERFLGEMGTYENKRPAPVPVNASTLIDATAVRKTPHISDTIAAMNDIATAMLTTPTGFTPAPEPIPTVDFSGEWRTRNGSEADVLRFYNGKWHGEIEGKPTLWTTVGDGEKPAWDLTERLRPGRKYR